MSLLSREEIESLVARGLKVTVTMGTEELPPEPGDGGWRRLRLAPLSKKVIIEHGQNNGPQRTY